MGDRRKAREYALQTLYAADLSRLPAGEILKRIRLSGDERPSPDVSIFAEELVNGTMDKLPEIDAIISSNSANWKIQRMSAVDRNVLRLAIYELCWCGDIPARVTLNEAIEIAKQYGTEESGSFINGILDKVAKELKKE